MKKKLIPMMILFLLCFGANKMYAQDKPQAIGDTVSPKIEEVKKDVDQIKTDLGLLKRIKISGYVQAQFQLADHKGIKSFEGGDFSTATDKRFMVRRGRLKVAYVTDLTQVVLQIDATEKGVGLKDAYISFTEPWLKTFGIQAGVYDRPFGFEIHYSSSLRESPERSRASQTLFPSERDLGAMLVVNAPKTVKFWSGFNLQVGLYAGDAINPDFKEKKDFIGRLAYTGTTKNEFFKVGVGVSMYNGYVYNGTKKIYTMQTLADGLTQGFGVDSVAENKGQYSKRQYFGADAQLTFDFPFGITQLRGEYIMGIQPGGASSSTSPNGVFTSTLPATDTYIRKFNAAYFYLCQNIMKSPFALVVKYDWYDPNVKVKGQDVKSTYTYSDDGGVTTKTGTTKLSSADIKYQTLGIGVNYKMTENIKWTVYGAWVVNEYTGVTSYGGDVKDNVYTLRMQYKF